MGRLLVSPALWLLCVSLLSFVCWARETGVVGGCEMSWMSPRPILLDGLTEQQSRLAKKYSLHLYRERNWDRGIEHGVSCYTLDLVDDRGQGLMTSVFLDTWSPSALCPW